METLEYVTRARHLWWIVLVPLLAAAAAGAWVLQQPPTWTGTATVQPVVTGAGPASQGAGGASSNEYVSAFQAIATGAALLDRVSQETGVPAGVLDREVEVARAGDSTGLVVRFAATDRDDVEPVLRAVTGLTLEQVFRGEVSQAEAAVGRAEEQVAAADAALTEFGTRTGIADPGRAYQSLLTQQNTLDARRVDAIASGDTASAEELGAAADQVRQTLPTYVALLTEYDQITAERDGAQDRLDRARERLDLAVGREAAADPAEVVFVEGPVERSQLVEVGRTAAVAAAVALVLCLLLASVLAPGARARAGSGRTRRPRGSRREPATDDEGVDDPRGADVAAASR